MLDYAKFVTESNYSS